MADGDGYYNFLLSNNWALSSFLFITWLAILFFINPLRQISKSRRALILMLSKEIATFLSFGLMFIYQFALTLDIRPAWLKYINYINTVAFISIRLHLIGMAWNRMIAIFFPFSYSKWSKKRFIRKICILIWIISAILTPINLYIDLNKIYNFPFFLFSRRNLEQIPPYLSMGIYMLICVKLLWIKYKIGSTAHMMEGSTTMMEMEKDHWKISLACLFSLVPFMLNIVVLQIWQSFLHTMSDGMLDLMITLKTPVQYFSNISEELCLTIICNDFRCLVRRQFRSICAWTFWCISMGRWKLMDENNENNKVAVTDASIRVSSLAKIRHECVVNAKN